MTRTKLIFTGILFATVGLTGCAKTVEAPYDKGVCFAVELGKDGETRETLGLTGDDSFTILDVASLKPRQDVEVKVTRKDGTTFTFKALCRIDTANELEYYRNGGILHYVLRKLAA